MYLEIKKTLLLLLMLVFSLYAAGFTISKIEFSGNEQLSDAELQNRIISYIGMQFEQKTILEDALRLGEYYESRGFYLVKINTPQAIPQADDKIEVIFEIEENGQLPIATLQFLGNNYLSEEFLLGNLHSRRDYLKQMGAFLVELIDLYNQQGFYFASAQISSITQKSDGSVNLEILITEGKYCRFSNSIIQGNKVTRKRTILQLARLENRSKISPAELRQAEENISARPYIETCRIIPLDPETLLYDIKEGAMTQLQALLGYDNNSGNAGRLLGFLDLNFENLGGTDRSAGFYWENRQAQHTIIELRYHESGWDLPLAGDVSLYREEMDSTWVDVSYELDIYWYDLFNKTGLYLEQQHIYPGGRRPEIITETEFTKAGAFWDFGNLDNALNPSKGYISEIKYYYIWSKEAGKKSGRQAVELRYFKALPISGRWVLSGDIHSNIIEHKNLTDFDIFYIGGAHSLRGYLEKQFSGYRVGWLNLEARYLLSRQARVSLNSDLGYYARKNGDEEILFSLGCGLRVPTPVGQFSFDFALPWIDNSFGSIMEGIVHFGLETRF
ncbi:MAG: BamA/TamA family outer membrane protein [Candidatus Cloacimonetes bacterium]|nr:BamA/TamA family outer membrane protein [Candidatus Cloacimonadota bacterium]